MFKRQKPIIKGTDDHKKLTDEAVKAWAESSKKSTEMLSKRADVLESLKSTKFTKLGSDFDLKNTLIWPDYDLEKIGAKKTINPENLKGKSSKEVLDMLLKQGFKPTKMAEFNSPANQIAEQDPMMEYRSPAKQSKGKIVYKDGKKYWQASDGSLHTGQVDDYERELAEDKKLLAKEKAKNAGSKYWYKIDGKKVDRNQYLKYINKPGEMEGGGKTTNNPDVYGRKCGGTPKNPKICNK